MKTKKLRILSALLALAMLFALMPTAAFAADDEPATSGDCGKDGSTVKWELVGDTLTISGEGEMADYNYDIEQPWYSQKNNITKIVIEDGVTTISKKAFYECTELIEADMSKALSLETIGESAFANCSQLKTVELPQDGVLKTIEYNVFSWLGSEGNAPIIEKITIPASVENLGDFVFDGCTHLTKVTFATGSKVKVIDFCTFRWTGLTEITIPASVTEIKAGAFYENSQLKNIMIARESELETIDVDAFYSCPSDLKITCEENVKKLLEESGVTVGGGIEEYPPESIPEPDPEPEVKKYTITIDNGTAYIDGKPVTEAKENDVVTIVADENAFDGMVFERWEIREGNVTLADDHAAETIFTMPAGAVHLEAMPKMDNDDSSWDAATIVTGAVIGTGTAILAYHIGTELYAEQVLGKDAVVPRTRGEVALLAWQLAGQPEVENVAPLTDEAKAQQWAVENGLLKLDAEGNFNAEKKLSKWKALRVLDAAQKQG